MDESAERAVRASTRLLQQVHAARAPVTRQIDAARPTIADTHRVMWPLAWSSPDVEGLRRPAVRGSEILAVELTHDWKSRLASRQHAAGGGDRGHAYRLDRRCGHEACAGHDHGRVERRCCGLRQEPHARDQQQPARRDHGGRTRPVNGL